MFTLIRLIYHTFSVMLGKYIKGDGRDYRLNILAIIKVADYAQVCLYKDDFMLNVGTVPSENMVQMIRHILFLNVCAKRVKIPRRVFNRCIVSQIL